MGIGVEAVRLPRLVDLVFGGCLLGPGGRLTGQAGSLLGPAQSLLGPAHWLFWSCDWLFWSCDSLLELAFTVGTNDDWDLDRLFFVAVLDSPCRSDTVALSLTASREGLSSVGTMVVAARKSVWTLDISVGTATTCLNLEAVTLGADLIFKEVLVVRWGYSLTNEACFVDSKTLNVNISGALCEENKNPNHINGKQRILP